MAGSATDDSSDEATIIFHNGILDNSPEHLDKVLTQPSKKSNGSFTSSDACTEFAIEAQSINSDNNHLLKESLTTIEDDLKRIHGVQYDSENTALNSINNHLHNLGLSSDVKCYTRNRFSGLNGFVLLVDDNTSKTSDDEHHAFLPTYPTSTVTTSTSVLSNSINAHCSTSSSFSSPSPPKKIRRKRKNKMNVIPRRNPKRVAQMEKASVDLAMKLSMPKRLLGCRTKSSTDVMRNCRQSCRTTGAILSPPRALQTTDWKDWPSEGLHERPFYNPNTKTIHLFDKDTKFISKLEQSSECLFTKNIIEKVEVDEHLATLTHQCLHFVLGYVIDIKQYNEIREKTRKCSLGEFYGLFSTADKNNNIRDACELLLDSCKLYCLCNSVSEVDLARYIDSLSVRDFKESFLKDDQM